MEGKEIFDFRTSHLRDKKVKKKEYTRSDFHQSLHRARSRVSRGKILKRYRPTGRISRRETLLGIVREVSRS